LGKKNRASLGAEVLNTSFTHRGPKVTRDSNYRLAHNKNRMDSEEDDTNNFNKNDLSDQQLMPLQ
jgi:hypothetical protein